MKNVIRFVAILVIFLVLPCQTTAQNPREIKQLFRDAEYYYLMEEYERAIASYEKLLSIDPQNSNVHYLVGFSYLNALGNRALAISHLEKATENVEEDYREGSYKERKAPVLAYFMLGRAYHVNNEFDKAIEAYQRYRKMLDFVQFAEIEYVKRNIRACELAESMIKSPVNVDFISMEDETGQNYPNSHPVISGNDSVMVYATHKPNGKSMSMITKKNGSWSKPKVIDKDIDLQGNFFPVSLSYDGTELYIVYQDYMLSDILVSNYNGRRWSRAEPLDKNINTRGLETHASISSDGKTLYFTSDRKGGWGGMDIYKSVRDASGTWQEPENLGFGINTYYNEETPFISQNDSVLYYSSEGLNTMGGYDVFYTSIDEEGFYSVPQNLGYPISTTDDDLFYNPGWHGTRSYYAMQPDDDPSNSVIYAVVNSSGQTDDRATSVAVVDTKRGSGKKITDYYYIMNNILFDFDDDKLNDAAIQEVERIYAMMQRHPEVNIELTGRTDSKGSAEYNRMLSLRRAESVKNYLVQRGILPERIEVVGIGQMDPVAINKYEDGSDAPEGRLLNRNVSIRIHNLKDQQIRMGEIFVPDRLVPVNQKVYTVLLLESEKLLDTIPDKIEDLPVSLVFTDKSRMYTLGNFSDRAEARTILNEVLDMGYPDAYIMEKRNFESTIRKRTLGDQANMLYYTIQIIALQNPVDPSYFKDLNVRQFVGQDGFHRYVFGLFESINEALEVLPLVKQQGYPSAFIKPMSHYERVSVE